MRATRLALIGALLWAPCAYGQATVGALLDAGAKPLPPEDFKREIMQRTIVGPTGTAGTLEVMYASNGTVQGRGSMYSNIIAPMSLVNGEWKADEAGGRICTSLSMGGGAGGTTAGFYLPSRCQYWFKLGDKYFLADSDTDRSAKVLVRTIKQ